MCVVINLFSSGSSGQGRKDTHHGCIDVSGWLRLLRVWPHVIEIIILVRPSNNGPRGLIRVRVAAVEISRVTFSAGNFLRVSFQRGHGGSAVVGVLWAAWAEPHHVREAFGVVSKDVIRLVNSPQVWHSDQCGKILSLDSLIFKCTS